MRYPVILAGSLLAGAMSALPVAAQQSPPPLAYVQPLPPQSVQGVQDRLRQAGAYGGSIDGIWGADSQAALERYQQAQTVAGDGPVEPGDCRDTGPRSQYADERAGGRRAAASCSRRISSARRRCGRSRRGCARWGSHGGGVDGVWGASTQVAIERFQQGRGLQPNGQLNPATISAMGLGPDVLAYR